jgi:O-methyltransferase
MVTRLRSLAARILARAARIAAPPAPPSVDQNWLQLGLDPQTRILWERVAPLTMTSIDRVDALRQAVEHVHANAIAGDVVECGVWRGGSIVAVALTLLRIGARRRLWLYDTFSGMTPPSAHDKDFQGRSAADLLAATDPATSWIWGRSALADVRSALAGTGYPEEQIEFVVGPVESTIPSRVPDRIALLRLDTDWYASTYHELVHLWPRLVQGGILIVDDYGDWQGAKKAVDQYFHEAGLRPFLHRIDGTGRLVIKS